MPLIRSVVWGLLVVSDVLTKVTIRNQLQDEDLEHFAITARMSHIIVVIVIPDCKLFTY